MSICNWLDLQTLGFQPVMPKNLPDHCSSTPIQECSFVSTNSYDIKRIPKCSFSLFLPQCPVKLPKWEGNTIHLATLRLIDKFTWYPYLGDSVADLQFYNAKPKTLNPTLHPLLNSDTTFPHLMKIFTRVWQEMTMDNLTTWPISCKRKGSDGDCGLHLFKDNSAVTHLLAYYM